MSHFAPMLSLSTTQSVLVSIFTLSVSSISCFECNWQIRLLTLSLSISLLLIIVLPFSRCLHCVFSTFASTVLVCFAFAHVKPNCSRTLYAVNVLRLLPPNFLSSLSLLLPSQERRGGITFSVSVSIPSRFTSLALMGYCYTENGRTIRP